MAERDSDAEQELAETLKITDRRLFTADGQLRSGLAEEEEEESAEPKAQPGPQRGGETVSSSQQQPGFERRPVEEPEGVDFTMLINAMAEPALLFLGEITHPSTGQPTVDLERARIQIDMLDLLRIKCRGNLTPEEEGLLERILYQLRMLYVSRAEQPPRQQRQRS